MFLCFRWFTPDPALIRADQVTVSLRDAKVCKMWVNASLLTCIMKEGTIEEFMVLHVVFVGEKV